MEKYKKQIPCVQDWDFNGEKRELYFEPDSSPKAWEHFKSSYQIVSKCSKLELVGNKTALYRLKCSGEYNKKMIHLSGDCSFNFNDKKSSFYQKLLESKSGDKIEVKEALEKLTNCRNMHHSLLNFDLMPVEGELNNLKGKLKIQEEVKVHDKGRPPVNECLDRLDTFIYFLDKSMKELKRLKGEHDLKKIGEFYANSIFTYSMKGENFSILYEFISEFKNIYEYCKTFYLIEDRKLVNDLIKNGKKPINEGKDVVEYMKLAERFWDSKNNCIEKYEH